MKIVKDERTIKETGIVMKHRSRLDLFDDLVLACQMLLRSSAQSVWLHIENPSIGKICDCKACSIEFAKKNLSEIDIINGESK